MLIILELKEKSPNPFFLSPKKGFKAKSPLLHERTLQWSWVTANLTENIREKHDIIYDVHVSNTDYYHVLSTHYASGILCDYIYIYIHIFLLLISTLQMRALGLREGKSKVTWLGSGRSWIQTQVSLQIS